MTDLSLYEAAVPVQKQILRGLSGILDKAIAHCEAKHIEPAALIHARLFPDMLAFNVQVGQAIAHSAGAAARLTGVEAPQFAPAATFEDVKKCIAGALAYLDGLKPSQFEGAADKEIVIQIPNMALKFSGKGYLLSFALPNFFFHATTAYDILRHNGIDIGKRDFIGGLQLKA